jgi:hypothetical protein
VTEVEKAYAALGETANPKPSTLMQVQCRSISQLSLVGSKADTRPPRSS